MSQWKKKRTFLVKRKKLESSIGEAEFHRLPMAEILLRRLKVPINNAPTTVRDLSGVNSRITKNEDGSETLNLSDAEGI